MNNKKEKLKMKFDPNTIDDLGAKLYTTLPPILAEQIANSYDAHAKKVYIDIIDKGGTKTITILDDGHGMSFEDINKKYLLIGRKRRKEGIKKNNCGNKSCLNKNRLPIGRKGLGKLSFFGISDKAEIETTNGKGEVISFEMDMNKIRNTQDKENYEPYYKISNKKENPYTKIKLCNIKRKTDFDIDSLKKQISNYFIFDKSFEVYIKYNNKEEYKIIDNEERYDLGENKPFKTVNIKSKKDFNKIGDFSKFNFINKIKGEIIIFEKPVPSRIKGLTLFSRGKLVNLPEFFPYHTSSHITQYLSGWLSIDFIEDLKEDVISTNRQSLNWENEELSDLKDFLKKLKAGIETYWRKEKSELVEKDFKKKYKIDYKEWIDSNKNNKAISSVLNKLDRTLLNVDGDDTATVTSAEIERMIEHIHTLAPEFAEFNLWRDLHGNIRNNKKIKDFYFKKEYFSASREAVQIYEKYIYDLHKNDYDNYQHQLSGVNLMEQAFNINGDKICLFKLLDLKRSASSESNIQISQKHLSNGLMSLKNVLVSHASLTDMNKYFTEWDCLYILSIISYLYTRLDRRTSPE